ncbi:MAG: hypothetical protein IKV32_01325 [Muribaculaceae bacterium]|nr:hypothetical protein [Muribaculaceae bacterium]
MRILKITLVALMSIAICSTAVADNYFEDDIYYDASKAKKKKEKRVETTTTFSQPISYQNEVVYNYGSSLRDIDEYNRQGAYYSYAADTTTNDSVLNIDGYTYTNRIERFYNPNVVSGSGNQELIDSYSVNQPVINIYVDDVWDPYPSWGWGYSWYAMGYYSSYYGVWNPYWYNPYWYNWGWSYCYDPFYHHHHHHHYPSYYPPHHNYRHSTSPGAYRPHYSTSASRHSRGSSIGRSNNFGSRGGSHSSFGSSTNRGRGNNVGTPTNNSRPNSVSNGRDSRTTSNVNRATREGSYQKGNNNSSGSNRRGSNMTKNISTENNSNSRSSHGSNTSRSSYSGSSGSSNRSSGGFSGGGSRGSHGGGGGGSRGRR